MIFDDIWILDMKIPSTRPERGTLGVVDRELDVERLGTTSPNLQTAPTTPGIIKTGHAKWLAA